MTARTPHQLTGEIVRVELKAPITGGIDAGLTVIEEFMLEGWWDQLTGTSWTMSDGNFAAMAYGLRAGFALLPPDDDVLYGKNIQTGTGHLIHVSELP